MRAIRQKLDSQGWVSNVFGRRYYNDSQRAYLVFNYLCQGSAGDYVKFRQLPLEELCGQLGAFPVLTTHDDITFEVPLDMPEDGYFALQEVLEEGSPFGFRLPVKLRLARKNLAYMEEMNAPQKVRQFA